MSEQESPLRRRPGGGFVHIQRIWRALTDPPPQIQQPEQRRRSQFLAALTLLASPFALIAVLVPDFDPQAAAVMVHPHRLVALGCLLVAAAAYILNRTGRYRLGSALLVGAASAAIFAGLIADPNPSQLESLLYTSLPVLLSSVLFSLPVAAVVAALHIVGLLAAPLLMPPGDYYQPILNALVFHTLISILILLAARYRSLLERDRHQQLKQSHLLLEAIQMELERRIVARTAELSELNDRLRQQIAERERAEEALIEERNLLRTLIENMPDMVFVLDTEQRYVIDNLAHRRVLGLESMDEVVGKTAHDFFSEEDAGRFTIEERAIMETGQPVMNIESPFVDHLGRQRWGLTSKIPFRDSQGKVIGLVGVAKDLTEFKQAQTLLQQAYEASEQRVSEQNTELLHLYARLWYQANLLENVTNAIISTDLQFVIQSWNKAAETMYGWPAEEVIGRPFDAVIQPEYLEVESREAAVQLLETGTWNGEAVHYHREGAPLDVAVSTSAIRNTDGRQTGWVMVCRDIGRRKQAQALEREQRLLAEALRDTAAAINSTLELDEVLNRIFLHIVRILPCDSANLALIEDDLARVVRYWGTEDESIQERIKTHGLNIRTTPTLRQMIETGHPLLVADISAFSGWVVRWDVANWMGSYIGVPIRVQGEIVGFLNVNAYKPHQFNEQHLDRMALFGEQVAVAISNARLYEAVRRHADELAQRVAERTAELEHERTRLGVILDAMEDGVISSVVDENFVVRPVYINRAMKQLLGYDFEDWYEGLVAQRIIAEPGGEPLYNRVARELVEKGSWRGEVRLRRKDDTEFSARIDTTRINNAAGQFAGIVTVVRDISQEKALQEQRSRFVANASHELRTPITNLMTRLWLLRKQPQRLPEHLVILDEIADRMRHLIEDLLDMSRFERGTIPIEHQPFDLRQIMSAVVRLQQPEAERKLIYLVCNLPPQPLVIMGDSQRIHQVITNLVINAIHYTPEGGQVQVSAVVEPGTPPEVIVVVADTGMGIAPEHLPNLFQPFYRVGDHGKGTGLGLAIVKEIVEMHGGQISVESEVGQGSHFNVRLPLWNQAETHNGSAPDPHDPRASAGE